MNIWTCGSSPRNRSRNAWRKIRKFNGASRLSKFWNFWGRSKWFPVRRDWWPWTKPGYITMTQRQNRNQWRGGIAAHPATKIPSARIRWKDSQLDFFDIKTTSSSLIIFQRAKLSTRSIINFCWCNWRTFWRKNAAGSSPMGSCSCTTMPRLNGHLWPKNWPSWASNVLVTHPILRIWLRRPTTCSLEWKNKWNLTIFRPTRR